MKKFLVQSAAVCAMFILLMAWSAPVHADTALKNDLALGGDFVIGGITKPFTGANGGFAFGIEPMVQYFVIDGLGVWFRFLWERGFSSVTILGRDFSIDADAFPLMLGARYYFTLDSMPKLKPYVGGGIGMSIIQWSGNATKNAEARAAFDMHGGVQYEVIDNLGIDGSFDIFLPNMGPTDPGENVVGRFAIMAGILYYLPL